MNNPRKPYVPQEIDDLDDRLGSIQPLNFDEDEDALRERIGDQQGRESVSLERVREAGMSGGETLGESEYEDGVDFDDLSPETLFDEGGARPGEGPMDEELSTVNAREIGGGTGLDEAELGRLNPLDGKPWDGEERLVEDASVGMDEDELTGDALLNSAAERTRGAKETVRKKTE